MHTLCDRMGRGLVVETAQVVLEDARARLLAGESNNTSLMPRLVEEVQNRADQTMRPSRRVINATGVVLHTNMGRAPLSRDAEEAMLAAAGYSDLEFDLRTGARGSRQDHVTPLIRHLVGAESATVVSNNAAAVFLTLRVLAARREVVISRGELVEIGDGFRIPDIIRQSSARLTEVGTTNRTTLRDYAEALSASTAAVLHVHTSNFTILGFGDRPSLEELATLTHERRLPFVVDNGSGSLVDTARFGLVHEPTPAEAIAAGADVVLFSTDKLLGGPQGGVIAGRADLVDRIRRHPLGRAVRPDKTAIAALHATLMAYVRGTEGEIPVLRMLAAGEAELRSRADGICRGLTEAGLEAWVEPGESPVGGGSLPGQTLPTAVVALNSPGSVTAFATRLRRQTRPLVARVHRNRVLFDPRTIQPAEDRLVIEGILSASNSAGTAPSPETIA